VVRYSEPRAIFLSYVRGAVDYVRPLLHPEPSLAPPRQARGDGTISGGNVTFGHGASINITTLTVADIMHAIQQAAASAVSDPEQRESFLSKLREVRKHPAATTILQTSLPELLRRLSRPGGPAI